MVTKIQRIGIDRAEPLERLKTEAERKALQAMADAAIVEVRQTLMSNLPSLPEHHRETIRNILAA